MNDGCGCTWHLYAIQRGRQKRKARPADDIGLVRYLKNKGSAMWSRPGCGSSARLRLCSIG